MTAKTFAAIGIASLLAAAGPLTAPPARADVDITINLGYGGFYGRNISCVTGLRIVESRFNYVRVRSCAGRNYDYSGKRSGKWYWIKVSSVTGRIVDVDRWYR